MQDHEVLTEARIDRKAAAAEVFRADAVLARRWGPDYRLRPFQASTMGHNIIATHPRICILCTATNEVHRAAPAG